MSNVEFYRRIGLTNYGSEDFGVIASSVSRNISFSLCCGEVYRSTSIDICNRCKRFLKWDSRLPSIAEKIITAYQERMRKLERDRINALRRSKSAG